MGGRCILQNRGGNEGNEIWRHFPGGGEALTCATRTLLALKDKGNEAFAKGDYESAVLRYSEGLEKLKDVRVLYTNRAQVSGLGVPGAFSGSLATRLVKSGSRWPRGVLVDLDSWLCQAVGELIYVGHLPVSSFSLPT